MRKAEIVIIGAGVVGASVASHLAERGCGDVLVLESGYARGLGSTGKATGGVRAQFETEINTRLSLYSLDFFRDWEFDAGYEPRGYVFLATRGEHVDFLERTGRMQREAGYSEVELLDVDVIGKMIPGLNCEDLIGGSLGPRDGFIDPISVLEGFAASAERRGARFEYSCTVASINVENGRVTSVDTTDSRIYCETVVLCTGARARDLAATAGIPLPVEPLRRQILWARSESDLPSDLPMVIDMADGFHFRPARNSHDEVLFAYPDDLERPGTCEDFGEAFIEKTMEKVRHRAPFLANAVPVREKCRAGLYEMTPDHHAILGGCEVGGLYFANGFSGHGVMHSPATGRALAEIILDGKASFLDVSQLELARFEKGTSLRETAFI